MDLDGDILVKNEQWPTLYEPILSSSMKTARKRQKPTTVASTKSNTNTESNTNTGFGCTRSKLPIKRARGQRLKKQNDSSLIEQDAHSLPSPKVQPMCEQLQVKDTGFREKPNNVPALELELGQPLQPAKFKLQLFPIDEITRKGLEKDGHNPYLELKLSHRKKIASVLKHLNSKWGSSGSAVGEPMLFPYNTHLENLAGHKGWTVKDTEIKAADVYEVIGRPAIFRLRYGWFTSLKPQPIDGPLTSRFVDCSQSANLKKVSNMNLENKDGQNKTYEIVSQAGKPLCVNETPNAVVGGIRPLNRVAQSLDNSRIGDGLSLSSSLWADSLTNISIGGLLSEASLHAAAASHDAMPIGSNSCQIPFSSDSFDAIIASHIYSRPQDLQRSAHGTHSSILDAEETCHAFSFKKFGKGVPSSKTDLSASSAENVNSKLFKSPSSVEEKGQAGITEDHACQEPKSCNSPNTRGADNVVSSNLGITDINWSDSMGPFESLLSSRQLISCDSISLGGLFANTNSLDLFRNCSPNCSPFVDNTKVAPS